MDKDVALLVSAWIETIPVPAAGSIHWVALLVSAWIETLGETISRTKNNGRTPRECVD